MIFNKNFKFYIGLIFIIFLVSFLYFKNIIYTSIRDSHFVQNVVLRELYALKQVLPLKEYKENVLDLNNPLAQYSSPINELHNELDKGKLFTKNELKENLLVRSPYAIIGHPGKFLYTDIQTIDLYYAGDLLLKGNYLKKIIVFDAVSGMKKYENIFSPLLPLKRQGCANFHGQEGCGFNTKLSFPASLLGEGVYYAVLISDTNEESSPIYFGIRSEQILSSSPPLLVVFPNHTWQAYNYEGGASLYYILQFAKNKRWEKCLPKVPYFAVNINRPLLDSSFCHTPDITIAFLKVLQENHIPYRITSNTDLHEHPQVLDHAKILLFTGHDEYWTTEIRKSIENFVLKGGNIANFSGNIAYWYSNLVNNVLYQARESLQRRCIRIFKKELPVFYKTGRNDDPFIKFNTEKLFGVSYVYAGYPVFSYLSEKQAYEEGISNQLYNKDSKFITILKPAHPVFKNTHLAYGDQWGGDSGVLGVELDGCPIDNNNELDKYFSDLFPSKMVILASAYAYNAQDTREHKKGVQRVGIFVECQPFLKGGKVISFGSIAYGIALYKNDRIAKIIFLNTIKYLEK